MSVAAHDFPVPYDELLTVLRYEDQRLCAVLAQFIRHLDVPLDIYLSLIVFRHESDSIFIGKCPVYDASLTQKMSKGVDSPLSLAYFTYNIAIVNAKGQFFLRFYHNDIANLVLCSIEPNRADGVFERFICKLRRAKFPNKNHFDDGFEITSPNRT